jgi:hypothetical protein
MLKILNRHKITKIYKIMKIFYNNNNNNKKLVPNSTNKLKKDKMYLKKKNLINRILSKIKLLLNHQILIK